MRSLWLFLVCLSPLVGNAQKWVAFDDDIHPIDRKEAQLLQYAGTIATDTTSIKGFLNTRIENLKPALVDLVLTHEVSSPKGKHYLFSQTINGHRVFRGSVKMNVSNDGRVLSIFDHTFSVSDNIDLDFPDHAAYNEGLMVHYAEPGNGALDHYNLEEMYMESNGEMLPVIRLEVIESTDRYYELILNKDVKVIYQNDLLSYAEPQDSTVTLWVFNPDPLTSANQAYGAPYADNSDQDVLELNAERIPAQSKLTFQDDIFYLKSDFVSIEEFSFPDVAPVTSSSPEFNYTRAEAGFEDVNAFYHINYFQQYIQSLGFTNLVNYQIWVDTHALNGSDNSNFNGGFSPPRLSYGEGGVDDAEDADVIIHEYGHAISNSAAPGTNNGGERKAIDEALGDYFASSYSRFISPNRWSDVFTWDGHNEYWQGRSSVSTDHYPENLQNNLYSDADIWSATIMQIWGDIGREVTDAIMMQTCYSFAEGMTMPQAAVLFLQADTLLFGGANFIPIRQRMFDRGLIPWNVSVADINKRPSLFQVANSAGFASGASALNVTASEAFKANLFNAIGQQLSSKSVNDGRFALSPNGLRSGVYFLELISNDQRETIKLVKH
ncbi:MAG: T9SS type A sorting domain-containing protein [Flavobacteriales bacterium]|nr:T9SS type A sorting domain-containing protein [Flavobacteriales bacterium]